MVADFPAPALQVTCTGHPAATNVCMNEPQGVIRCSIMERWLLPADIPALAKGSPRHEQREEPG